MKNKITYPPESIKVKGNFLVESIGNETYVYFKGNLIHKKWHDLGYSRTFCHWGGPPF